MNFLFFIPVGWGGHYYDLQTLSCAWDRLASQSYSIFFPMSSIILPCIVTMICYMRIFIYARNASNKIAEKNSKKKDSLSDLKRSVRIAKGLFASFMLFVICW